MIKKTFNTLENGIFSKNAALIDAFKQYSQKTNGHLRSINNAHSLLSNKRKYRSFVYDLDTTQSFKNIITKMLTNENICCLDLFFVAKCSYSFSASAQDVEESIIKCIEKFATYGHNVKFTILPLEKALKGDFASKYASHKQLPNRIEKKLDTILLDAKVKRYGLKYLKDLIRVMYFFYPIFRTKLTILYTHFSQIEKMSYDAYIDCINREISRKDTYTYFLKLLNGTKPTIKSIVLHISESLHVKEPTEYDNAIKQHSSTFLHFTA